jgi:hypothetical protein
MGVWTAKAKANSSNWKEATTILHSLRRHRGTSRLRGATVFYITDNLVSYYIVNNRSSRISSLQQIVEEINLEVAEQGCRLEVVHAPGDLMIVQGTDGQSRGIWVAPERRPEGVNQALFEPVAPTAGLMQWALAEAGFDSANFIVGSLADPLQVNDAAHKTSIWFPPPECGRQYITHFLRMWVQHPWTTSAVFIIPRILQKQWGRISRYVEEMGVYHSQLLPHPLAFDSPLPFVVLRVAPHTDTLRKPRLDRTARPFSARFHQRQAEEVRGLL